MGGRERKTKGNEVKEEKGRGREGKEEKERQGKARCRQRKARQGLLFIYFFQFFFEICEKSFF